MKKVAAVFVSIGVILVIAGLVMVGIFGGEAIKNISWNDIVSGTNHDLASANGSVDKTADELQGLNKIAINTDRYSVYVLPSENDALSVKYVDPLEKSVKLDVTFDKGVLTVTETDTLGSVFFIGLFRSNRFVAVYVPQTETFTQTDLEINAITAGVKVQNVAFASAALTAKTGSVNASDAKFENLTVETNTGAVNINNVNCGNINAETTTGAVNINDTKVEQTVNVKVNTGSVNCHVASSKLILETDTGSVNFTAEARDIKVTTDTGSINGTVLGNKEEYNISVSKDTGKSNIDNQTVPNAEKFLTVEVDTGTINIDFDNK